MKAKKWVAVRRSSQVFFFLLFTAILWSTTYPLKGGPVPTETVFRIDPLVIFFTSLSERALLPGIILSSIMILLTLIFGRFFCGWVCPLGAAFDLAGLAAGRRRKEDEKANARNRKYKYAILATVALSAVFGVQAAWALDPLGIMSRFLSLSFIPYVSSALRVQFNNTFINTEFMSVLFLAAVVTVLVKKRFWCRSICPLGAIYALTAKAALLHREVRGCSDCGACAAKCRMGAIRDDFSYSKGECILCMDCVYDCPAVGTSFGFGGIGAAAHDGTDASRRNLLILIASSVLLSGFGRFRGPGRSRAVIRPPAALPEDEFVDRCIRCGNCMRVCITNGLQPAAGETGVSGIWTPKLVPEIGYCEYNC
ncbi:MAG TPA: 4Fe-4S binding protein, partial [Candidatus Omnitrophota bacterium]|nr:4Fe-4S binding protein [Candidatus Omnitrophota bacterium]